MVGQYNAWNRIYTGGSIHTKPSSEVTRLIPKLREANVVNVLDAGCGTGRHALYLAQQGFYVYGIDVSTKAIQCAQLQKRQEEALYYAVGKLSQLPYVSSSMDFILANQSLQYASDEEMVQSIDELDRVLRPGQPFFLRVASIMHPFNGVSPDKITGFSHIGECLKAGLPIHFFSGDELTSFFQNYRIDRLEHIFHEVDHEKITVPLAEWVMLAYKNL